MWGWLWGGRRFNRWRERSGWVVRHIRLFNYQLCQHRNY